MPLLFCFVTLNETRKIVPQTEKKSSNSEGWPNRNPVCFFFFVRRGIKA